MHRRMMPLPADDVDQIAVRWACVFPDGRVGPDSGRHPGNPAHGHACVGSLGRADPLLRHHPTVAADNMGDECERVRVEIAWPKRWPSPSAAWIVSFPAALIFKTPILGRGTGGGSPWIVLRAGRGRQWRLFEVSEFEAEAKRQRVETELRSMARSEWCARYRVPPEWFSPGTR